MDEITMHDFADITNLEKIDIPESDIPTVIANQYQSIIDIDAKIQLAQERCSAAQRKADEQVSARGLAKAETINSTQDAVRTIAEAQTSLAEAQKALLLNQQKMAEGMRFLLMLGASSISMNRSVIQQLEIQLKRAETETLSQSARDELIGVIRLLREQETTFQKQARMSEQIADTRETVMSHTREIAEIHHVDEAQARKDEEHDTRIGQNEAKNSEQDGEIDDLHMTDREHDSIIKQLRILTMIGIGLSCVAIILAIFALFF